MITGGSVTVEDGKKAGEEYAPARKVSVTINFDAQEDIDMVAAAGDKASAEVARLLGTVVRAAAMAEATASKPVAKPKPKKPDTPESDEAPEPGSKADLEAKAIAAASASKAEAVVSVDDGNDLSDLIGDTTPAPISDKELSDACIAKANKMKSVAGWEAKKIRTLMEEFTGAPGKRVQEIPSDKRRAFLDKLEALK